MDLWEPYREGVGEFTERVVIRYMYYMTIE